MGASERFLPRVTPLVSVEKPGSREALATDVAGMGEAVGEHVHRQGRHAHVELVADVARLRRLQGELAMGLLVSGQVGAGGKMFSTLCTPMIPFFFMFPSNMSIQIAAMYKRLGTLAAFKVSVRGMPRTNMSF